MQIHLGQQWVIDLLGGHIQFWGLVCWIMRIHLRHRSFLYRILASFQIRIRMRRGAIQGGLLHRGVNQQGMRTRRLDHNSLHPRVWWFYLSIQRLYLLLENENQDLKSLECGTSIKFYISNLIYLATLSCHRGFHIPLWVHQVRCLLSIQFLRALPP